MRSIISTVSISLKDFLSSILLWMVIIVAVVIVTVIWVVIFVNVIVGVVIVVAIIGVVVFVTIIGIVVVGGGVPSIIKLSFVIIGFLHRITLYYLSPDESFHKFLGVCVRHAACSLGVMTEVMSRRMHTVPCGVTVALEHTDQSVAELDVAEIYNMMITYSEGDGFYTHVVLLGPGGVVWIHFEGGVGRALWAVERGERTHTRGESGIRSEGDSDSERDDLS
ncbi:hypothetical protein Tco_1154525 [Tanacetum coccineum]